MEVFVRGFVLFAMTPRHLLREEAVLLVYWQWCVSLFVCAAHIKTESEHGQLFAQPPPYVR